MHHRFIKRKPLFLPIFFSYTHISVNSNACIVSKPHKTSSFKNISLELDDFFYISCT